MKSKASLILCVIFEIVWMILIILSIFLRPLRTFAQLLTIFAVPLYLPVRKCPYCGRHGLHPRLWEKNAGYCRRCGRLVEYSDQ